MIWSSRVLGPLAFLLFFVLPIHSQRTTAVPGKDGVGYPACVYCPAPSYTKEGRKAKFEGAVRLQVVIEPDGHATDIKVLNNVGYGLENSAVQAVQSWRFRPAAGPDGKPVAVLTPVEVTFRLR
jgi:TonB family protein